MIPERALRRQNELPPMFGVILLPDFALQAALRHQPTSSRAVPVAVLSAVGATKPVIFQCNAVALSAGVQAGMTSSQGLGRCGQLRLLSRAPGQEAAVAEALLETAFSCSPWVEATADGVCTVEWRIARAPDEKIVEPVITHLARLDLRARIGLAVNPDLALLAAHAAKRWLRVDDADAFLAHLPVSALNPTPAVHAILQRWGVETLGALSALPAAEVTRRLGVEGHDLWLRAAGRRERLLRLARVPETYVESMEFEYEVQTLEPLLFVLRRFLEQLVLRLEANYRVPAALTLTLRFDDGLEHRRHLSIPAPTGNVETLFRVLYTHLENFTASAPIKSLHLTATPTVSSKEQFGLFETALRDPNRFSETLARLHALLGNERAGVASREDTHRPDAFRVQDPDFLHLPDAPAVDASASRNSPIFGLPLRRLRPPQALQVEVSHRIPARIESGLIRGQVRAARGPYQLLGGWWEPSSWACEEWDVELVQGGLYRLSLQPDGWFLEGTYG